MIDEVGSILSCKPRAFELFAKTTAYFGQDLRFHRQGQGDPASCLCFRPTTGQFVEVIVKVHPEPAAITHECLHLMMAMDGFPIGWSGAMESRHALAPLENLVAHAMFIDVFLNLGFNRAQFVFDSANMENVGSIWATIGELKQYPEREKYMRGYWNGQYLAHLIARRLEFPDQLDEFLRIGRSHFTTMDRDAQWIERWLDRAEFRDAKSYAAAMNELLTEIGFDPVGFVAIRPIGNRIQTV